MPLLLSDHLPTTKSWLSSLDGAIPTKVQLVLWLLCPAPLAISEDILVVIAVTRDRHMQDSDHKEEGSVNRNGDFSCKKCPLGMLNNVEIEFGSVFYNYA